MDFTVFLCLAFAFFIVVVVILPNLSDWSLNQTSTTYTGGENPNFSADSNTLLGSISPLVNDRPYGNNLSRSPIYSSSRRTSHRSESRRNTASAFSWLFGSSDGSSDYRTTSSSRSSFGSSRSSGSSISTRGGFGSSRSSSRSSSFGKSRSYGGTRSSSSFSSRSSSSRTRSSSRSSSKPKTMKKSSSFKKR